MNYSEVQAAMYNEIVRALPRYMFDGYKVQDITSDSFSVCHDKVFSFIRNKNQDTSDMSGITVIDKFVLLPEGSYVVEKASINPDKTIEAIASLIFYLSRGDYGTAYSLIQNISNDTKNKFKENQFSSPRITNIRRLEIDAWAL